MGSVRSRIALLVQAQGARRAGADIDSTAQSAKGLGDETGKAARRTREADRDAKRWQKTLRATAKTMAVGVVGGIAAIGAASTVALNSARTESGALAQVTNTFGEGQLSGFQTWANGAAESMGMARAEAYKTAADIGRVLSGFEIPAGANAAMTKALLQRTADIARFTRQDQGVVQSAMTSALMGRTKGLAKFGIQVNKSTLQEYALRKGMIATEKQALTPAQKAMATYGLVMEQTRKMQGAYAKDSDSWVLKQKRVKAQIENVKATLGTAMMPVFSAAMSLMQDGTAVAIRWGNALSAKVRPAIQAVSDWLLENKTTVDSWVATLSGGAGLVGDTVDILWQILKGAVATVTGWVDAWKRGNTVAVIAASVIAALSAAYLIHRARLLAVSLATKAVTVATTAWTAVTRGAAVAQHLWNVAMNANPIMRFVVVLMAVGLALYTLYKRNEKFRAAVQAAVVKIRAAWETMKGAISGVVATVKSRLDGMVSFVRNLPGAVRKAASGMWSGLTGGAKGAVNAVITLFNKGFDFINKMTPGDIKAFGRVIVPGIPDIPHIPLLAAGGNVSGAGSFISGEAGAEEVRSDGKGNLKVTPLEKNGGSAAGGKVIELHSHLHVDGRVAGTAVRRVALRDLLAGAAT
ncbi:MAG: hypothetical protein PGN13_16060 [Patulibacter minatonensis]